MAKINLVHGVPTVTHRYGEQGWWWNGDTTPKYGDVATYRDENSDYIYILGNPPNYIKGFPESLYIYQARVRAHHAFDLDKYEYWWGRRRGWRREVLTQFDTTTAVMWGCGQGQIVYNKKFRKYIYVHMSKSCFIIVASRGITDNPWLQTDPNSPYGLPPPRGAHGPATRRYIRLNLSTGGWSTLASLTLTWTRLGRR